MDFGIGLLGYHGCWDDAAFAEKHGFATAGFVDSPLLGADPFVCMTMAAQKTQRMRIGTFLAIPSGRNAATTAAAAASVNRLAPGRVFLGVGTGFTGRATFGLPRLPAARLRRFAADCRALLDGDEVVHQEGSRERHIRFAHHEDRYVDTAEIPVYVAADGPKALAAAGQAGDGWIITLQYANVMENAPEVFKAALDTAQASADAHGRSLADAYKMYSACVCILEPGEAANSPRALEHIGAGAMMPFHAYADDPSIAEYLPPPIQDRLEVYEREVLAKLPVERERLYQETHRGHLSHLLPGEEKVLTDEIVRMTTLTGTAEEIADVLRRMEAYGLSNLSLWIPPELTRDVVLALEAQVMPLLSASPA